MKLSRLLDWHHQNSPQHSLPLNFGDGFLIKHNSIYGAVRTCAIEAAFEFSNAPNGHYLALPLSQLDIFLENKTIPYKDNVSVLDDLEKCQPQQTDWDDITDNLKQNHVFHESCHAVARHLSSKIVSTDDSSTHKILRLLIEESFSNSCELLGIAYVDDSAHRIFYELNSFIFMYEERSLLKNLVTELGLSVALQFLVYCYLYSNFLHERLTDDDLDSILKHIKVEKSKIKNPKLLRSISKIAFQLNPRFRLVTTVFYLRLGGLKCTAEGLKKIDFMGFLKQNVVYSNFIKTLSQMMDSAPTSN